MNWRQIENATRVQPSHGDYTDWKQQIADDCFRQCVYCAINEGPWGGIDHYHIDHFRPKSIEEFKALLNIITNLYYSCPICNRFKQDDWPNEPDDLNKMCYPDPSEHNYSDLFSMDENNYTITGLYVASRYLVNRLYLNRPQLVYERREFSLKNKAESSMQATKDLIQKSTDLEIIKKASLLLIAMHNHLLQRDKIRPYKLVEIRKP
jgi:hypothetical protein